VRCSQKLSRSVLQLKQPIRLLPLIEDEVISGNAFYLFVHLFFSAYLMKIFVFNKTNLYALYN
jgi:hypothetical protein